MVAYTLINNDKNKMVHRSFVRSYRILLIVGLFVFITVFIMRNKEPSSREARGPRPEKFSLNEMYNVKTHKGLVPMSELNEKVFKKFGYEIESPTIPVPTLRMINGPTCETVFSEWLRISKEPQPDKPPGKIPAGREDEFLLYGYAALQDWYINDKNSPTGEKPRGWDTISDIMKWPKQKLGGMQYGRDGESMYNAIKAHRLDGKRGFVVGSMAPWVEVTALLHGASHVLTVEYNNLTIQQEYRDRMASILPVDFVKDWEMYAGTFDFAASFSSIEHSGLGRYGDPIDPIGDLREMLKIKCMLKKGGLLFLGFPFGTDALAYNAHRIYGSIRLALMFYGFEWLDTFTGESEEPFDLNAARLDALGLFQHNQRTVVLRKL